MKQLQLTTLNVDKRISNAINESMRIYCNKLVNGKIPIGLEATFQHELALILTGILESMTLISNEHFSLTLEENIPINGNNNYVDIVIHYDFNGTRTDYLIELKFKKITDKAPDRGTIETFFDIYNLDKLHNTQLNPGHIKNSYVIFLTDLQTYKNNPQQKGTRYELPMFDGAHLLSGHNYMVSQNCAKKLVSKQFGPKFKGFTFTKNLDIEYNHFLVSQNDFWYFILEI